MPQDTQELPQAVSTSQFAKELSAKTTAAVSDTGLDAGFDAEVDAAIAKDSGDTPAKPAASPAVPAKPTEAKAPEKKAEPKAEPMPDIPSVLLEEKKKPEAEPKPEQTDAERQKFIEEQTKGLSPKAADRFRAIEKAKHEAEQKASAIPKLEKELAELRAKAPALPDNSALEALQKERDELDALVQKANLSEHPKFKAHYDGQREKEIAIAKSLVADPKAAAEVEALLSLPDTAQRNRRLNEIIGELEPLEAGKFQSAVDKADRLANEKQNELNNWRANKSKMQELSQAEQQQTQAQRDTSIQKALQSVVARFSDNEKGIEIFRKVDGNDDWNKQVDERFKVVADITKRDLGRDEIAELAAWAATGKDYRKLFLAQRAYVDRLKEEIQSLKGGEPELGEEGGGAAEETTTGNLIDDISREAQKMGVLR